jgi:hypothetical protein
MAAELRDWLAELGASQAPTAAEVGAALLAVMTAAEPSDLAIVGEPGQALGRVIDDPRDAVDDAYQQLLEQLRLIRHSVADAASARRAAALELSAGQAAGADATAIDALAERVAAAQRRDDELAQASRRVQDEINAFQTAKETAKARYVAAAASLRIAEAVEAADGEPDPDLAQRRQDYGSARQRLRALGTSAAETLDVIRQQARLPGTGPPSAAGPPERPRASPRASLLELRADPFGSDIRILFAAEPADVVTLLAVLEGPEAVSEHGQQAAALAADLLAEIRAEGWLADIEEVLVSGPDEFLATFFPAHDGSIARRAGVLTAITSLARLRAGQNLTIEEVAAQSGIPAHRVTAIELEGLRTARVHEAVALARVLGARLELPAGADPVAGEASQLG